MRILLLSVSRASASSGEEGGRTISIGTGLAVTIGLSKEDSQLDVNYAVMRITGSRLWKRGDVERCREEENSQPGKMWFNAVDLGLEILCHCSITLAGNVQNGSRLDVHNVMKREDAKRWWEQLRDQLVRAYGNGGESKVKFAPFGCAEAVETVSGYYGKYAWFDTQFKNSMPSSGRGKNAERYGIKAPSPSTIKKRVPQFAGDEEIAEETEYGIEDLRAEEGYEHDRDLGRGELDVGDVEGEVDGTPPERLRRAEAVLARRTARIVIVLEYVSDVHNHSAILRTAEAMGVQDIYVVRPAGYGKGRDESAMSEKVSTSSHRWLTLHRFYDAASCIKALKSIEGMQLWTTELSPRAMELTMENRPKIFPERVALVFGREMDGVSEAMRAACDKAVYLPMYGFTESLNVSVAAALVLQRIMDWCTLSCTNGESVSSRGFRGDLGPERVAQLRGKWYKQLLSSPQAQEKYGHWALRGDEVARSALSDLRRNETQSCRGVRWKGNNPEKHAMIQDDRAGKAARFK